MTNRREFSQNNAVFLHDVDAAPIGHDEADLLNRLVCGGHLVATIDKEGKPFHFITTVTQARLHPDKLILWLDAAKKENEDLGG